MNSADILAAARAALARWHRELAQAIAALDAATIEAAPGQKIRAAGESMIAAAEGLRCPPSFAMADLEQLQLMDPAQMRQAVNAMDPSTLVLLVRLLAGQRPPRRTRRPRA